MGWLDEIEARGYTNDLTPNDVYLLLVEVRRLREENTEIERLAIEALNNVMKGRCEYCANRRWRRGRRGSHKNCWEAERDWRGVTENGGANGRAD